MRPLCTTIPPCRGSISIHAPARGATNDEMMASEIIRDFNPRTREGCDVSARPQPAALPSFQSTHPRGVRLYSEDSSSVNTFISIHAPARGATEFVLVACWWSLYFNPRTREGCDGKTLLAQWAAGDFNPRTREGCDPTSAETMRSVADFNPRTREGCDGFEASLTA